MVVTWRSGQIAPDAIQKAFLDRAIATAQRKGVKIVLVVYPAVPREHDAEQFCAFMKALAVTYEYVDEWGVGNEVNKADFWSPPSPESYLPVLARCFDLLEAEGETVIGFEFSPRKTPSSPSPVQYLRRARVIPVPSPDLPTCERGYVFRSVNSIRFIRWTSRLGSSRCGSPRPS